MTGETMSCTGVSAYVARVEGAPHARAGGGMENAVAGSLLNTRAAVRPLASSRGPQKQRHCRDVYPARRCRPSWWQSQPFREEHVPSWRQSRVGFQTLAAWLSSLVRGANATPPRLHTGAGRHDAPGPGGHDSHARPPRSCERSPCLATSGAR